MRILILSSYLVCPPISGGVRRFLAPVLHLKSKIQYRYSLIYMSYSSEEIAKNNQYLQNLGNVEYSEGILTSEEFQWDWRNSPAGLPLPVWYTMNQDFLNAVIKRLGKHTYDLIQIGHPQFAWLAPRIRSLCPESKIILEHQNLEWLIYKRWVPFEKDKIKRASLIKDYKTLEEWEDHCYEWFDAIFCISPVEKAEIEKISTVPTYYIPAGAGINDDDYLPAENLQEKYDLFFIGSMNWYPNVQGLVWFIEEVMPLIQREYPEVGLEIAGSGRPDPHVLKLIKANKNITFWGQIKDERRFLHQSKVFISPVWIGAGVRLKNPTAWAAKLPVVATSISVEGLEYTPDYDVLIGDTPEIFAEKVISLLKDKNYRELISERAYQTYKKRYSVDRLMNMWEQGYQNVLSS